MSGYAPNSYDEVPYTSFPYPLTHPDRLATVGRLFGMAPGPIETARVLELGCAAGGNLIAMAEQLPNAELVGVDLSARQIADGQAAITELGLDNVHLRQADLTNVDDGWGRFDYVLCHGVYSWVPPAVQDRILEICAQHLQPNGVAYISYNTYPGWHAREAVRHMMRFHVAQFPDARERTDQAAALVDFLASSVDEGDFYAEILRRELDTLARTSPEYLFHEHLEEHNAPCYFHQFAERLAAKKLQYLGEADVHTMLPSGFSDEVAETLGRISPDIIALEQYMDFVRNRQFRQTLVCHGEVELDRNLRPELMPQFMIGFGGSLPAEGLDLAPDVMQTFPGLGETTVGSAMPITKAALAVAVQRWPDVTEFDTLVADALARLAEAGVDGGDAEAAGQQLAIDALACFVQGTLELRVSHPSLSHEPSPRPRASAFARWQAKRGGFVTNRRHVRVDVDDTTRLILSLLDGSREPAAITETLVEMVADGRLSLSLDDTPVDDAPAVRDAIADLVSQTLSHLAELALLER